MLKRYLLQISFCMFFFSCTDDATTFSFDEKKFNEYQSTWEQLNLKNYSFRYEFTCKWDPTENIIGYVVVRDAIGLVTLVDPMEEKGYEPRPHYEYIDSTSKKYLTSMDDVYDAIYASVSEHRNGFNNGEFVRVDYTIKYDSTHPIPLKIDGSAWDGVDRSDLVGHYDPYIYLEISDFKVLE